MVLNPKFLTNNILVVQIDWNLIWVSLITVGMKVCVAGGVDEAVGVGAAQPVLRKNEASKSRSTQCRIPPTDEPKPKKTTE